MNAFSFSFSFNSLLLLLLVLPRHAGKAQSVGFSVNRIGKKKRAFLKFAPRKIYINRGILSSGLGSDSCPTSTYKAIPAGRRCRKSCGSSHMER
jgi:hypothetical protein